jgi:hypothetical protein
MVHHLEGQSSRLLSGRSSKDRSFHFSLVFVCSLRYSLFSRLRLVSSKFIHSILGQECNITNRVSRRRVYCIYPICQVLFGISIRFLVRLGKLSFDLIIEAVLRFDYVVPQHFSQKSRSCHWKSRRRDPVFRNISTQLLKLKQLPLRFLALAILT